MLQRARCNAVRAVWIVLRGPFGAPQDGGGGILKQALINPMLGAT